MAWIDKVMTRECLPVLESGMGFAHQKALVIANNIANVETPEYRRETVPEDQFYEALRDAIHDRDEYRTGNLDLSEQFDVRFEGHYPHMRLFDGKEYSPERHDENTVTIEHEMADLTKNALKMQAMQQLYKKNLTVFRAALRDRVA